MANISDLCDELLVKILSFLPTKVAVSTSILSKQWEFLWMWLSNLEFECTDDSVTDFINRNLPLHRAPIINTLCLTNLDSSLKAETFKSWVEIAVSRGLRELECMSHDFYSSFESLVLPSSLYTCNSLVTLKLDGWMIHVDVPEMLCLPSLKTLQLIDVVYSNSDSLRLLLSFCPVLEDLTIERQGEDNVRVLVIIMPSLQRLSLRLDQECSSDGYVIVTPSLKYFKLADYRSEISCSIKRMPELEEAYIRVMQVNDIDIEKLLKSVTIVKRLSIHIESNSGNEIVYGDGIVFNHLENLKLQIYSENWSKILFQLLKDSPNLQILDLEVDKEYEIYGEYEPISWINKPGLVPKCLSKSLKTFKFKGSTEDQEERDFLSFIFRHACCLKSTSFL